jgi:hypothetical protein
VIRTLVDNDVDDLHGQCSQSEVVRLQLPGKSHLDDVLAECTLVADHDIGTLQWVPPLVTVSPARCEQAAGGTPLRWRTRALLKEH